MLTNTSVSRVARDCLTAFEMRLTGSLACGGWASGDVLCVFSVEADPFRFDIIYAFYIFVVDDLVVVVEMNDVLAVAGDCDVAVVAVLVPGALGGRLEPEQRAVRDPCWNNRPLS